MRGFRARIARAFGFAVAAAVVVVLVSSGPPAAAQEDEPTTISTSTSTTTEAATTTADVPTTTEERPTTTTERETTSTSSATTTTSPPEPGGDTDDEGTDDLTGWSWVAIGILVVAIVVLAVFLQRQAAARRGVVAKWDDEQERALDRGRQLVAVAGGLLAGQPTAASDAAWRSHDLDLAALEHRFRVLAATAPRDHQALGVQQVADAVADVRLALGRELQRADPTASTPIGVTSSTADAYAELHAALDDASQVP